MTAFARRHAPFLVLVACWLLGFVLVYLIHSWGR